MFYGGGGNMGPLYPGTRLTRLEARGVASAHGLPLIVLPQSWTGPEEFEADQFFARENRSLEFCPRAVLAPDLGLAYAPAIQLDEPQHDVGWFMRDDCERASTGRRQELRRSRHPRRNRGGLRAHRVDATASSTPTACTSPSPR